MNATKTTKSVGEKIKMLLAEGKRSDATDIYNAHFSSGITNMAFNNRLTRLFNMGIVIPCNSNTVDYLPEHDKENK